jgi:MoaA/NifB/PqqE/SkfB family radical SAM enzyme
MSAASERTFRKKFENRLFETIKSAKIVTDRDTRLKAALPRLLLANVGAAWRRAAVRRADVAAPPILIVSVTKSCNLSCAGCYSREMPSRVAGEMSKAELGRLFDQASALGVSVVMLAGGEPFLRPDLVDLAARHQDMIFIVFTNGSMIDDALAERLAGLPNVIPALSIEGDEAETDARRGNGAYARVREAAARLRERGKLYGASITVTAENIDDVTSVGFAAPLVRDGAGIFFFIEYVPVAAGTERLVLSRSDKAFLGIRVAELRDGLSGLFIAFPGDEEQFGGCLAAGRGFLHVAWDGSLEACPFAPFSDANVRTSSLRDALSSDLMRKIRGLHGQLVEGKGGCALWSSKDIVGRLADAG